MLNPFLASVQLMYGLYKVQKKKTKLITSIHILSAYCIVWLEGGSVFLEGMCAIHLLTNENHIYVLIPHFITILYFNIEVLFL